MKKRLLLITCLMIVTISIIVVYDYTHVSKEEYKELVENHPYQQRKQLSKKERKKMGIPPNRYFDEQYLLEMNPKTGKTHPENLLKVRSQRNSLRSVKINGVPGQSKTMKWEERGPNNIGGRTRVVFFDPNDSRGKRVFAGGVSGGLWVNNDITNEQSVWSQVGIDENLSISCYAIDPNDSNIWYVGTGEAYTQGDGVGNGIWKTTNGGATWENILKINLNITSDLRPYFINQILAWNNGGTTELFFSVDGSLDVDPVGHQSSGWWTNKNGRFERISFLTSKNSPYVFSDIEIALDNSIWVATKNNLFGAGGGKIFRSIDGINFTEKYSFPNGGRVELSLSKLNANVVYAIASTNDNTNVELVKTNDGNNFTSLGKPKDADFDIPAEDFTRGQGFYNLTLEVDPNNDAILYAGGIDLFRSNNSGVSWSQISKWSNSNILESLNVSTVHADHHAVIFDPNDSNKAVFANDGGVYYSSSLNSTPNNVNSIQKRNLGYNITQFYSGAIGQNHNRELLMGGTQDNGSLLSAILDKNEELDFKANSGINSFVDVFGGDGIQNFIDKDEKYIIMSYVNNVYASRPLPLVDPDNLISIAEDRDSGTFANVADLDDNLDILYSDGSLYDSEEKLIDGIISRYTNLLEFPQRRNFKSIKLFESPTAIKVSPFTQNSSTVFIGTKGATILKVTNLNTNNPTWTKIDNDKINIGSISDIDFGENENEILVTLHNYGVKNIYFTKDGGVTWLEKEGDFPDIPVKAIKMNPLKNNEVIIGTNSGVWATGNFNSDAPNWVQSQNGMSNVKITSFDMRTSDNTVLAATYGRGLFTGKFNILDPTGPIDPDAKDVPIESKITIVNSVIEKGEFNLTIADSVDGGVNVFFYAVNGHLLKQVTINNSDNSEIDIPFTQGVYIVVISSGGDSYSKKIIVTN